MKTNFPTYIVTAAIIQKGNKILIARRAPNKHLSGYWEFPGGKIEEGETPEDCLKREIMEELGLEINVRSFFMENEHIYSDKKIILKAYLCELISGKIQLNDHDLFEWSEVSDLENYKLAPADIPFVKALNNE
ncbi:8-oxo-dGTP diphosphatase MutT [Lutibacter citreus]|uniref:8-oxo-dGTP diphosphatase MutT n=1 Tax=Lutibacter citreus TaxID=2138210 RepID=UPI001FE5EA65|nr:8-oxo-dGTP diphosphatase MutT [Lutibacter citreus]